MEEKDSPASDTSNPQCDSHGSTKRAAEQGKQDRSLNALKFGFFSRKALLPGESWPEFEEFHAHLMFQLSPRNPMEAHIIEQYIGLAWRLKRLPEIEAQVFGRYGISMQGNQCGPAFALVATVQSDNILAQLARYEATLRKNAFKYLDLIRTLRKDRWGTDASGIIDAPEIDRSCGTSVQVLTPPKPSISPTESFSAAQLGADLDPEA